MLRSLSQGQLLRHGKRIFKIRLCTLSISWLFLLVGEVHQGRSILQRYSYERFWSKGREWEIYCCTVYLSFYDYHTLVTYREKGQQSLSLLNLNLFFAYSSVCMHANPSNSASQAAICEIRAGRWVRNGSQVRSQVRLYAECHFCNSLQDLDIFLLQVSHFILVSWCVFSRLVREGF